MKRLVPVWLGLLVSVCGPVGGAEILSRSITIDLRPDGFTEKVLLRVEITEPGDLDVWSEYAVVINDHIELVEARIEVIGEGRDFTIPKRKWRNETSVGFGLHSSARALVADLPMLAVGDRLNIETVLEHRPYFKSHQIQLQLDTPQRRLEITVNGFDDDVRWQVTDPGQLFGVAADSDTLKVTGSLVPARLEPALAGDASVVVAGLKLAWDEARTWDDVARWYDGLVSGVDGDDPAIRELAARLTDGIEGTGPKTLVLIEYVKKRIRYEAVEIGVGGWVPTPAGEVADRAWGDCKDKSVLLRDLLAAIGVTSRLTLLHLGRDGQIDPNFPSTNEFNHCILAVKAEGIADPETDPVIDGWVLVDPTMDRGSALWLSPYIQGQWVLVTDSGGGALLQLPEIYASDGRVLIVRGRIDASGSLTGTATIRLIGSRALAWVRNLDRAAPESIESDLRQIVESWLPGATTGAANWRELTDGQAPAIELQADFTIPEFLRGTADRRRLRPTLLGLMPDTRDLEDRNEPVILTAGVAWTRWEFDLTDDVCPVESIDESVETSIGALTTQVFNDDDGRLVIDHKAVLRRSWIVPAALAHLQELAVAEDRRLKRSIRFSCGDPKADE